MDQNGIGANDRLEGVGAWVCQSLLFDVFHQHSAPQLDNFCAFLDSVINGLEPEISMEKYQIYPGKIPGSRKNRDEEIVRLRMDGLKYTEIGKKTGTTKYTVYRVCKKAGLVG